MAPEPEAELKNFVNFPSPPGVATSIVELARQVERIFALDKEATGKRIAKISALIPGTESIFEMDIVDDPDSVTDRARNICERMVAAFQSATHDVGDGRSIPVTVSIGFTTHCADSPFDGVESLLKAADQALCTAKLQGRSRTVRYDLNQRAEGPVSLTARG